MDREAILERIKGADCCLNVLEHLTAKCVEFNNSAEGKDRRLNVDHELYADSFLIVPLNLVTAVDCVLDEFWRMIPLFEPKIQARMSPASTEWRSHSVDRVPSDQREPVPTFPRKVAKDLLGMCRGNKATLHQFVSGIIYISTYQDRKLYWKNNSLEFPAMTTEAAEHILSFDFSINSDVRHTLDKTLGKVLVLPEGDLACIAFFRLFLDETRTLIGG